MNKKIIHILSFFLISTFCADAQSDAITLLESIENKIEIADNQRDTSILIDELTSGVVAFSNYELDEKAFFYFGKLSALSNSKIQAGGKINAAYEAIAKIYCRKKEYFIAATYLERAIKIANSTQQTKKTIQYSLQLCDILLLNTSENKQKTKEILQSVFYLLEKNPDDTLLGTFLRQKGTLTLAEKKYDEAILQLKKAVIFFQKIENTTEKIQCFSSLSKAYEQKNNPSKSPFYLQKYLSEKDKNTPNVRNTKEIYEGRKKDKSLIISDENKKNQIKKIAKSKFLIFFLLFLIALLSFIFAYYHKKSKQKISLQNTNIQAMMNELKAFNYSVSHDLKAPLVEMYNSLSRIEKDETDKLHQDNQAKIQQVSRTLLNTKKMIDEMLSYSITDNQGFEPQKFDTKELLEDLMYQFSETIEIKRITVRIAPNFPQIYGDLAMIRQVFQNLISNAIKFSQNNPAPMLQLDYKKEKNRLIFSVSDNGIGFDTKYKNKLFQLFKRLPTQEKFEGIGAGLAIVKRIIERHGGEVWAEGSPNKGAVFYFSLPKLS